MKNPENQFNRKRQKIDFLNIFVICEVDLWQILLIHGTHITLDKYLSLPKLRRNRVKIVGATCK